VERCAGRYVVRHAALLLVPPTSPLREGILGRLGRARELDLSAETGGAVGLLALAEATEGDTEGATEGATEAGLKVVLHASSPLTAPSIAALLASLVCPGPFSLLSSAAYPQYPASPPPPHLPLRPLREHGCVPLCSAPALVAAGDWAKGRGAVQAAVDSGERAAGMLRMLRGGEEVKYAVDE
jgi:hypothetical protein